ncbi:MAG: tetratricopeptide repeat protein [Magnetococcales bacterium]|nr:tetratricopeptide repeat protein [Magnetococcales bacterium]
MSVIYRALRNKKRGENTSMIQDVGNLDGGADQVSESGFAGFLSWFAGASPALRAAVVTVPVLVLGLIGGGGYWVLRTPDASKTQTVAAPEQHAPTAPVVREGQNKEANTATKAADELLFGGVAEEGSGKAAPPENAAPVTTPVTAPVTDTVAKPVVDAGMEEKALAIFGGSGGPKIPETKAEVRKEPPPITVTKAEEEAALGKRRPVAAKPVENKTVPPEVLEGKDREIGRVVADLRLAMSRNDAKAVNQLFATLGKVKAGGEQDPFVLNMRAYWEITNGQYDKAASLLKVVLERRHDDLEAGLNMAVVELRTNQSDAARERLFNLLKLYPVDTRPGELLRYLR